MKRKLLSMIVLLMTAAMSAVAQLYAPPSGGGEKTITLSPNNLTLTVGEEATVSCSLSGMGTAIPSWRITEGDSYIDLPIGPGNSKTVSAKAPGTATIECYQDGWTSGRCTVTVNPANVTLTDGNDLSGLSTYTGKTVNVAYSRSFTEGKPSTVCLPFAYTKKTGDGSFYAFTNIEKVGSEYVATMTEPSVSTLTANTPYLYMPSTTGDVDFSGTYAIPADLTAGSTTSNGWTFKGTYEAITWTAAPTGTYGFSGANYSEQGIYQGQFVKVGENVSIKPMRCYLENASFAGARGINRTTSADEQLPETIKVRLVSASGKVTAIGSLQTKTGKVKLDGDAWYTLDGRHMEGKPGAKGIYINNNKKVIVK